MKKQAKSETNIPKDGQHVRRIWGMIVSLCFLGVLLAGVILSVFNDMYAFVKSDATLVWQIEEPLPLETVARKLQQEGIVENPHVLLWYARYRGLEEEVEGFAGEVKLSAQMSYREILRCFL